MERSFKSTFDDYLEVQARLPPLKVLHSQINDRLRKIHETGAAPYKVCRFKAGDQRIVYEEFPIDLSIQVIRAGLNKVMLRQPRWRKTAY